MAHLTVMGDYQGPGERKTAETLARDLPDASGDPRSRSVISSGGSAVGSDATRWIASTTWRGCSLGSSEIACPDTARPPAGDIS